MHARVNSFAPVHVLLYISRQIYSTCATAWYVRIPGHAAEVGEVQYGAAVAGVHDGVQLHALAERPHDGVVDLVVQDLAAPLEVHGAERLVVPVHLVVVHVQLLHAVPGEVEHQRVAAAGPLHEPPHRPQQVLPRRHPGGVTLLLCRHHTCMHEI